MDRSRVPHFSARVRVRTPDDSWNHKHCVVSIRDSQSEIRQSKSCRQESCAQNRRVVVISTSETVVSGMAGIKPCVTGCYSKSESFLGVFSSIEAKQIRDGSCKTKNGRVMAFVSNRSWLNSTRHNHMSYLGFLNEQKRTKLAREMNKEQY